MLKLSKYIQIQKSIISLFIFHFQFIPLFIPFPSFSFFFHFSCLISQANATQNSKRESFPPFSISLNFSLFNFIDLRQTTYFYKNSLPSAKESNILLNKSTLYKFGLALPFYLQDYSNTSIYQLCTYVHKQISCFLLTLITIN